MSFIQKSHQPPRLPIGELIIAYIQDIVYPVPSPPNSRYPPHDQVQFNLELDDGHPCKSWLNYKEHPHEKSNLATLCRAYMMASDTNPQTVHECLKGIKAWGKLYVECIGYRESYGVRYPKLKIHCDKFPLQHQTSENPSKGSLSPEQADALKRQLRDAGYLKDEKSDDGDV